MKKHEVTIILVDFKNKKVLRRWDLLYPKQELTEEDQKNLKEKRYKLYREQKSTLQTK